MRSIWDTLNNVPAIPFRPRAPLDYPRYRGKRALGASPRSKSRDKGVGRVASLGVILESTGGRGGRGGQAGTGTASAAVKEDRAVGS